MGRGQGLERDALAGEMAISATGFQSHGIPPRYGGDGFYGWVNMPYIEVFHGFNDGS